MSAMFKAVVWKELRANFKWGVLALLGMTAGAAYTLDLLFGPRPVSISNVATFISSIQALSAIGAILAGLLIGAAQSLAENRGDKWGFLVHRPMSRSALFRAKAAAGILLYSVATTVPVAVVLLRMAMPGYLPVPFDWGIALPVMANLLGGLVCYFAGLLTGMRQARWFGSRALSIGTAAGCLLLQIGVATAFWHAMVICAAGLMIVGIAAWSTFVAGGQYEPQPRLGRIATGISIGTGMALAGFLVVAFIIYSSGVGVPQYVRHGYYGVTADGEFVRVRLEGNRIVDVSDLDGVPLERFRDVDRGPVTGVDVLSARLTPGWQSTPSLHSTRRLYTPLADNYISDPHSWYYIHGKGLTSAFSPVSRGLAGWMGPEGFSQGKDRPRPFAGRLIQAVSVGQLQTLLVFKDGIYEADLGQRQVKKVFTTDPGETILAAGAPNLTLNHSARLEDNAEFVAIATTQRVLLQLQDGSKLLEVSRAPGAPEYPVLQVFRAHKAPGAPIYLWRQSDQFEESQVAAFNSAGVAVKSWTLPPEIPEPDISLPMIGASSAIAGLPGVVFDELLDETRPAERALARPVRWTAAILASLLFAAAAFSRGRRHAFPQGRLLSWTVIALLLGPLGYFMMLALVEWPAHENCPSCSRKRVVTRESCEHCGAPFPAPARDGTEIFDPAPADRHG